MKSANYISIRSTKTLLWLMLLALSSLTAACGAVFERDAAAPVSQLVTAPEASDSFGEAELAAEPSFVEANVAPIDDVLANSTAQVQGSRVIIYTGNISLVVKDTQEAVEAITDLANGQAGYVASSNIYQFGEVPRGSITIRVPAERYQDTLAELRALAVRVENESSNTQDVTEEFTDLEARQTNLEFTEAALQKLLDERQRVGKTSDILEVYRELTNIRGQIEQIEGRLRYLANQSALSTITIELIPDVLSQPVSVAGWQPQGVAKEALQALVVALQGLANILIWLVILVLPLLITLLIPVVVLIWLIRRWWKRYKARQAPPPQTNKVAPESVK